MNRSDLRSRAFEVARQYATVRGEHLCAAFDDSFSGDLARFHVLRKLRRLFPNARTEAIDSLIEEDFTP